MARHFVRWPHVWRAAGLALALAHSPANALAESAPSAVICPSSLSVPLSLDLAAPEASIVPGATVTLTGTLFPGTELVSAEVAISSEGAVELLGPRRARQVRLDEEHRRRVLGEPEPVGRVHRRDREGVQQLERAGLDTVADHPRHGLAGTSALATLTASAASSEFACARRLAAARGVASSPPGGRGQT